MCTVNCNFHNDIAHCYLYLASINPLRNIDIFPTKDFLQEMIIQGEVITKWNGHSVFVILSVSKFYLALIIDLELRFKAIIW